MEKLLNGKIAVVTGGTRGIGKAIALAYAKEGATVVILGTNPEKGKETVEELKKFVPASFYQVDIGMTKQVEEVFQKIYQEFGAIDILVNNAGITKDNLLMRMTEADWDQIMITNLKSVYNTCKAVIRAMMKSQGGKIINITSVVGLIGNAGQTNYAASKAGMIGFTKSLAKEVATRNICVNCIAPGFIQTDMTDALNEKQKEGILSLIPMQKLGTTDDIAAAAVFLASPNSKYITGQVISVDGGMAI